ncbi:MAG: glycosyltransferase [Aureliella sp.]
MIIACVLLALAALPAFLTVRNIGLYLQLPDRDAMGDAASKENRASVSVLIPARDEENGIAAALDSVLANEAVELEVLVMDDHSTDRTPDIVQEFRERDPRVRLIDSPELPEGWNGKQHACYRLAEHAKHDLLLFLDADVRLSQDAIGRLVSRIESTPDVALLSGFPNQETGTIGEKLLIPMMHFVLLGYLPLDQMRDSCKPEFGAGCGQLFLARRQPYFDAGGHAQIRSSRHDGLKLPRAMRAAGHMSDLVDASEIATVRMYQNWAEVIRGLLKNANEGIARAPLIFIFTLLLLGGSVLPVFMLAHAVFWGWSIASIVVLAAATALSWLPRVLIAIRLQQSLAGAALHPVAVAIFVALQWTAFAQDCIGFKPVAWRGRVT